MHFGVRENVPSTLRPWNDEDCWQCVIPAEALAVKLDAVPNPALANRAAALVRRRVFGIAVRHCYIRKTLPPIHP